MSSLGVDEALSACVALRQATVNLFMERRRQRPAGQPTRLQAHVLSAIADRGGLLVSEVADLLEIAPATTSRLLSAMEQRGWLTRAVLDEDRRRRRVELTAQGRGVVAEMEARRQAWFRHVLVQLSAEERGQLVTLARRVAMIAAQGADPGADQGGRG
jgi:DNA-binding MarR family transcriptional regulator